MRKYIEQEAVMRTARDGYHSDFGRSMADLTSLSEVLEDTPTADVVEVKRGKWKVDETHDYEPYCSLCGHEPIAGEKYNYCPDCGSDMRGDKR